MDVREKLVELIKTSPREDGCIAIEDIADHLIANGVTVQKWVSVKDKLPDYFTGVLVWCPGNKCIYAAYRNARQEWYTFDDTIAGHVVVNMVTHWMPMPHPPTDKSNLGGKQNATEKER